MSLAHYFSLIFFITFTIYLFMGMYILSLNTKSGANILFFGSCLALALWAFCFSMANTAIDYDKAFLWRRWASLGWGTVYSLMLHFFIMFTEPKWRMNKKLLYMIVYIPAILNVYIFGSSDSASIHYNLLQTSAGWINISANGVEDLYFNAYYVLFTLMGIFLLWLWGKNAVDKTKKGHTALFVSTLSLALILGSLTDVLVNKYTVYKVPQLAPVFVLLPIVAMFYTIKRYGLLEAVETDRAEPGKILTQDTMGKFITIMSFIYMIGGTLNFAAQYFLNSDPPPFKEIMLFSAFFFIIGIVLVFLRSNRINRNLKEYLFILIMLISILSIAINFTDSASITVWAAPFIIVMLSVLFNKRYLIHMTGALILLTQVYIWIKVPFTRVKVDSSDYLTRIVIFGITLGLAYFVNRVYVKRLEENEDQVRFQMVISKISAEFVNVSESNLDEKIKGMLGLCGRHLQVDRTYFVRINKTQDAYEWCNEGIESAINAIPKLSAGTFPWWTNEISASDLIVIERENMLPNVAEAERELFKSHGIKSLAFIAVNSNGKILGFLFFASVKKETAFGESHKELLKIVANILADALIKVESELEIRFMAYYDGLTGLPNHTLFKDRLAQAIHLAKRSEMPLGVLFLDLDDFKTVNDTIGHLGGDDLLQMVGERLSKCLRRSDTVSRFGGDEFLIILTGMDHLEAIKKIANKIIQTIARPLMIKDQELFVTASIGISIYPTDGEDTEELIKNADLAMFAAKQRGKNQFALCSPVMKEDVLRKMKLTNSLYRAIEKNELVVYYQPQVNTISREITGLEALLRWNSSEFGMVTPDVFIPLAEHTGLIVPIGKWVLETACRQHKIWQEMGVPALRLAVNLSIDQFRDREFTNMVQNVLNVTGFDSKNLEVEITESLAMEGKGYIVDALHRLRALGISISIDDFGIEYSSLNRLKTLPVDRLKIDMQFSRGVNSGTKDKAIAKTIIQLAKNLEMSVIAEGVETEDQYAFFREYKCDEIQGYYFYQPLPAEEVQQILKLQIDN